MDQIYDKAVRLRGAAPTFTLRREVKHARIVISRMCGLVCVKDDEVPLSTTAALLRRPCNVLPGVGLQGQHERQGKSVLVSNSPPDPFNQPNEHEDG